MEAEEASLDHVQGLTHSEVRLQLPPPHYLWAAELQGTIQRHPATSALLLALVGHRHLPNGIVFCSLSISVNDKGGIWGRGESVHELPSNCQEVWRLKAATSPMEPTHPASSRCESGADPAPGVPRLSGSASHQLCTQEACPIYQVLYSLTCWEDSV